MLSCCLSMRLCSETLPSTGHFSCWIMCFMGAFCIVFIGLYTDFTVVLTSSVDVEAIKLTFTCFCINLPVNVYHEVQCIMCHVEDYCYGFY